MYFSLFLNIVVNLPIFASWRVESDRKEDDKSGMVCNKGLWLE